MFPARGKTISKANRSVITSLRTTSFIASDKHQPEWSLLWEDGGLERELGRWMLKSVMNRNATPSNSISRLTSCSQPNLHENQIHKFSHGFDQEFCGCYCSLWIVVKVMADGNVSWKVCWHSFPFLSQLSTRGSLGPTKDQPSLNLEWCWDLSPSSHIWYK